MAGGTAAPASQVACGDYQVRGGGLAQSGTGVPRAGGRQAPESSSLWIVFPSTAPWPPPPHSQTRPRSLWAELGIRPHPGQAAPL